MKLAEPTQSLWEHFYNLHLTTPFYMAGFICSIVCIIGFRSKIGKERLLLVFPIFSYLIDLVADYYSGYLPSTNNHWIYNLMEIPLITLNIYIFYLFENNHYRKKLFLLGALIMLIYHIGYLTVWGNLYWIDVIGICFAMLLLTIMAYFSLVRILEQDDQKIVKNILFWFTLASFIYYIGRIPITALTFGPINLDDGVFDKMYVINDVLYVFWYLTIAIGVTYTSLWMKKST